MSAQVQRSAHSHIQDISFIKQHDDSSCQFTVVCMDFSTSAGTDTPAINSSSCAPCTCGQMQFWPDTLGLHGEHVLNLQCPLQPAELRSSKERPRRAAAELVHAVQSSWQQHWEQQQQCPERQLQPQQLVLVGHGFGGHMVKEVCLQLQRCATSPHLAACQRQQYACILHSIAGVVFFSTPHQPLPRLALPEYEYVLPDMASVCQGFRALCKQHSWQTLGVGAALQGPAATCVSLSAAAKGMTSFVAVPLSQEELSRPTSNTHPSYVALQQFLEQLSKGIDTNSSAAGLSAAAAGAAKAKHNTPCSSPPARLPLLSRLMAC